MTDRSVTKQLCTPPCPEHICAEMAKAGMCSLAYVAECEGGTGGPCCDPDCEKCWPDEPEQEDWDHNEGRPWECML